MLKLCCLSGLKSKLNSVLAVHDHEGCCLLVFRRIRLLSRVLYNSSLSLLFFFIPFMGPKQHIITLTSAIFYFIQNIIRLTNPGHSV